MGQITRRDFYLGVAAAGAAFGLNRHMAISAPAAAQKTPDPEPGFYRYKVGNAECIALYDGIWEKAHEAAFIRNATVRQTKKALAAAGMRTNFVPIPIMGLVVRINGKLVLCDAGGGGQVKPSNRKSVLVSGKLLGNLRAAGIDPSAIETILISHFHPDHIFGLLEDKTNKPVFPNAEIIVPAAEYKWWTDPSLIGRLAAERRSLGKRIQDVIPDWKNVLPVAGEDEVVPGIRFVIASGHTPGHTAFHLSSGNEQLLISADTVYLPALLAKHPDWQGAYDQDGPRAAETRRRLMDRVIADGMMVSGAHFPWPGVGRIAREGAGYAFTLA